MKTRAILLAAASAALMAPCFAADRPQMSLYERLGGMPAIRAVVDSFANRILADERVNPWFAQTASDPQRAAAYKAKLADFICQGTGGPCRYSGPDLVTVHQGRGVTNDAFAAVVEDLVAALDQFHVPEREKADLLAILGPMKTAVVER